jgi:hypothetical protein
MVMYNKPNSLYITPSDKGFKKEGYCGALSRIMENKDKFTKPIFKKNNLVPPSFTFSTIIWDDLPDENATIKEHIEKLFGPILNEKRYPSGLSFYQSVDLETSVKLVFNDLIAPSLPNAVIPYIQNAVENGIIDNYVVYGYFNTTQTHHGFNKLFTDPNQKAAVIFYIKSFEKEKTSWVKCEDGRGHTMKYPDGFIYADGRHFYDNRKVDHLKQSIETAEKMISDLTNMGMVCRITFDFDSVGILCWNMN